MAKKRLANDLSGRLVIKRVLDAATPRPKPTSATAEKNKYAVRFADAMGKEIADGLATQLSGIEASAKRNAKSARGNKQLDVNFSTPALGLALGVSLKSVHIREATGGERYTHNLKRNEEELRIEASGYHKRQPYAVMVGVLFLPVDSCDDGKGTNPSSFGSWVRHLRPYSGRRNPHDDADRFEKIFIGLYDPAELDLFFFDVDSDPPRNRRPRRDGPLMSPDGRARRTLEFSEFLEACRRAYLSRNSLDFKWDDGIDDPLQAGDSDPA